MAIRRRSLFGFPPPENTGSNYTARLVPLTTGVNQTSAWPLLPPGSAQSMTNYLPLDGKLVPRSRLSSIHTTTVLPSAYGMAELVYASSPGVATVWYSSTTLHARIASNGSISKASFVSAGGLGASDLETQSSWQYAPVYHATLGENMLVAAGGSYDTLVCLYQQGGTSTGQPVYSYLTSAPKALSVCAFDNYLIAFNVEGTGAFLTRVQWCVRGEPSNWTGEGSGYEDLLEMRGNGTAVRGLSDGRVILFTDQETWYGLRAAYPAQFQFFPLDKSIGCPAPRTIAESTEGLLFLGSDWHLRRLPIGGGASQIVVPQVREYLRRMPFVDAVLQTWGVFDPYTRLYHLFVETVSGVEGGVVVNVETGEVGFTEYQASLAPYAGTALGVINTKAFSRNEGLLFANTSGIVSSTNSLISLDTAGGLGSTVTSTWRSGPLAPDLPSNHKQVLEVNLDYRSTSRSTVTLGISTDGGYSFGGKQPLSLASSPVGGRVQGQVYNGSRYPAIELASDSTGYELHRVDVTLALGGRSL